MNNTLDIQDAIALASNDQADAKEYLEIIAGIARRIDDVQDADHGPVDAGLLAYLCLVALPSNPFFARNAARLVPLHDLVINAWQDSNRGSGPREMVWADLVNEIACSVAGITGGYHYRRGVSGKIRNLLYELEDEVKSCSDELQSA